MEPIADRIARINERIAAAARRANRVPESVRLIGISKTHPAEVIAEARAAGLGDFGESRVQEAEGKIAVLGSEGIRWHLIGHLQTNKAKKAAALFDVVHSVDSVKLASALSREITSLQSPASSLEILLQVNTSGEESKEGFALSKWEEQAIFEAFCSEVEQVLALPGLAVRGLMTIAPFGVDPRPTFRLTRLLREALAERFPHAGWAELSMGMSDDFEIAIEEGATLARVGRAIFGER